MEFGKDYTTQEALHSAPDWSLTGFFYQRESFDGCNEVWEVDKVQAPLRVADDILLRSMTCTHGAVDRETAQKVIDRWNDAQPNSYRYRLLDESEVQNG